VEDLYRDVISPVEMSIYDYAKKLRKQETEEEELLREKLRARRFKGFKFRRQSVIQLKYIADFYCAEKKLIIEIDRGVHKKPDVKFNDGIREADLVDRGYTVIRFWNSEVMSDLESVLERIATNLN